MRFKCALLLAAISIAAAQAAPCDDEASLALDALARNVSVHIGSPPTLTIGSDAQVSLDWDVNVLRGRRHAGLLHRRPAWRRCVSWARASWR